MIELKVVTDVLIVGTGAAGLYAALNIRKDLKILMITKTTHFECNSYLAQGGICTVRGDEDISSFIEDTMKAGKYKNNKEAVRILVEESKSNIDELAELGVPFDTQGKDFQYTREGGHSINRIVHCEDITGKKVTEVLYEHAKRRKNITILENTCLFDILCKDNKCLGAVAQNNEEQINIFSKVTILACGGIGGVFKDSTNQRTLTGDGIAVAIKNNIKLKDVKYIQIHPTALYEKKPDEKRFLISESVRGEGGKLKNIDGMRFINELLPRDIVSSAIFEEEKKTKNPFVYLDISSMPKEFLVKRFPGIYKGCLERGVDITLGRIPVTPVQHYFMGGIEVDTYSRTSMRNLFACGETSCTGVHGANRLASNSLLEAIVFSKRAASIINKEIDDIANHDFEVQKYISAEEIINNKRIVVDELKKVMEGNKDELVSC